MAMPASLRNEMKCSPATPGWVQRVAGQLVGDLEAFRLGVGRRLDPAHGLGRHVDPGHVAATKRMPPTVRRMQIDGIIASRSLRPVSAAACMNRSSSSGR